MVLRFIAMLSALVTACSGPQPLVNESQTRELVNTLQRELAHSIDAEKSAVLATTDEDSQKFAGESREASDRVEAARVALGELLKTQGTEQELEKWKTFSSSWASTRAVDTQLLQLAVENTNLKATSLASHQAWDALHSLTSLLEITGEFQTAKANGAATRAALSAMEIQTLLPTHIASPDDATMTTLEARINELQQQVDAMLTTLKKQVPAKQQETLQNAGSAWTEYKRLTADIVKLSRRNSNVKSFEMSTHEKRVASRQCTADLEALSAELQRRATPTR